MDIKRTLDDIMGLSQLAYSALEDEREGDFTRHVGEIGVVVTTLTEYVENW